MDVGQVQSSFHSVRGIVYCFPPDCNHINFEVKSTRNSFFFKYAKFTLCKHNLCTHISHRSGFLGEFNENWVSHIYDLVIDLFREYRLSIIAIMVGSYGYSCVALSEVFYVDCCLLFRRFFRFSSICEFKYPRRSSVNCIKCFRLI